MGDMTLHGYWQCQSVENFETKVKGGHGVYSVGIQLFGETTDESWVCSCSAFKYAKTYRYGPFTFKPECKHIKEVMAAQTRCNWQQFVHGGDVVEKKDANGRTEWFCPKCGGPAESRMHAI
jgi:hypothetical protein